ncbi:MAG: hypothetical protein KAX49_02705 [Halanaerobiales bacterium]|nr:hypothetical protein [Halanaerobiales bacterium]
MRKIVCFLCVLGCLLVGSMVASAGPWAEPDETCSISIPVVTTVPPVQNSDF